MCSAFHQIYIHFFAPMLGEVDEVDGQADQGPFQLLDESGVVMALEVSLDDGAHATLAVRRSDSPVQLAVEFGEQHGLSPEAVADVLQTIQDNLADDASEGDSSVDRGAENGRSSQSPNGGLTLAEMIAAAMGRTVPPQPAVPSTQSLSPESRRSVTVSSPQAFQRALDPIIAAALDVRTPDGEIGGENDALRPGSNALEHESIKFQSETPRARLEIRTNLPELPAHLHSVMDTCGESGYTCLNVLVLCSLFGFSYCWRFASDFIRWLYLKFAVPRRRLGAAGHDFGRRPGSNALCHAPHRAFSSF
jgi:hypothetical protein